MRREPSMMNSSRDIQEFKVEPREDGTHLLSYLADHLRTSKKKAKDLLDDRCILVNRRRVWMAHHVLRTGHTITLVARPAEGQPGKAVPLLYEDPYYLIVDKPSGRFSNEAQSVELDLREQLNEPGLLVAHRLDRDTTGCLLVARSKEAFDAMVELFRQKMVSKSYHAIVAGRMPSDPTTITKPIEGLPAITHCKTLDSRAEASHLLVKIDTGRTHQIRKHLADLGFPVIGDRHYATRRRSGQQAMQVGRQMLHASGLAFKHPMSGRTVRVRAPLPRDFRNCLKMFGLT
jgi:23S rRNA pseudouridine1911/1915/1917 synthase